MYQVSDFPEGQIFEVRHDREVIEPRDYYAVPSEELWPPLSVKIASDSIKVGQAFDTIRKAEH